MKRIKQINIMIVAILVFTAAVFILPFTIEGKGIEKDISEKYQNAVILSEKNTKVTQILFFSVGETKIGIANYIKIPFAERYYRQEIYAVDTAGEPPIINDVLKGGWHGYLIEATPESVKILKVDRFYGVYWYIVAFAYLLLSIEALVYLVYDKPWKRCGKGNLMKTDKFIKTWEKNRRKGRMFYALKYGVIMGFSMLTASIISDLFIMDIPLNIFVFISSMLGGVIGGVIGGYIRWDSNEEKYRKYVNDGVPK